jgi:hypothetical protein
MLNSQDDCDLVLSVHFEIERYDLVPIDPVKIQLCGLEFLGWAILYIFEFVQGI